MALASGRCPECGFDPPTVSPSDAAAAARSFPRRYRAVLVRPNEDDPEIVHRRPVPGEPSALDHATAAAVALATVAEALARVQVHESAHLDLEPAPVPGQPVAGAAGERPLETVLDHVAAAAGALADAIESVHGDEWARIGVLPDGEEIHALDVARAGVHASAHHLRAAGRVLTRVRLMPR